MTAAADRDAPLLIPVRVLAQSEILPGGAIDLAFVTAEQDCGRDPTAHWRHVAHDSLRKGYAEAPAAVAATFVAQWVMQCLACAALFDVRARQPVRRDVGPWIVVEAHAGYPREVLVRDEPNRRAESRVDRLDPDAAYRRAAEAFISSYRPGIPMSSWQRSGLIRDVWLAANCPPGAAGVIKRQSCCLIYALPGLRCCAGCPRLTSRPPVTSAVGEQGEPEARSVEQS